jgi:hypothetical protein
MDLRAENPKSSEPRLRLCLVKPGKDGRVSRRSIEALYRALTADLGAETREGSEQQG